jgi:hypothetical protein
MEYKERLFKINNFTQLLKDKPPQRTMLLYWGILFRVLTFCQVKKRKIKKFFHCHSLKRVYSIWPSLNLFPKQLTFVFFRRPISINLYYSLDCEPVYKVAIGSALEGVYPLVSCKHCTFHHPSKLRATVGATEYRNVMVLAVGTSVRAHLYRDNGLWRVVLPKGLVSVSDQAELTDAEAIR